MKHIVINLPMTEAERIKPRLLKMMESITPIIFRDRFGRLFVIIHGLKNRGFVGHTEESLREYVQNHSNIKPNETLYIISCFSATNKLQNSFNKMYVETYWPVFFGGVNIDEYDAALHFDIITDVSEIDIFTRGLATALSISEAEARAIINGED